LAYAGPDGVGSRLLHPLANRSAVQSPPEGLHDRQTQDAQARMHDQHRFHGLLPLPWQPGQAEDLLADAGRQLGPFLDQPGQVRVEKRRIVF